MGGSKDIPVGTLLNTGELRNIHRSLARCINFSRFHEEDESSDDENDSEIVPVSF